MNHLFPLLIGWLQDLLFGDPEKLPHPIVWYGRWIAFGERHLNKGAHRKAKGALFAVASILGTFGIGIAIWLALAWLIDSSIAEYQWIYLLLFHAVSGIIVFYMLAGHTLRKEVRMVFEAADRGLEEGRRQVARIVGRDTSELSDHEVRTAALETLAENLSDGVIAPLFWYSLLGLPGIMTYKMVNTLDSMIGYHTERYIDFGCWAARIDDIANYIPARLTALLMVFVAWLMRINRDLPGSLFFLKAFGPQHASPNSGWPEAALAGILNCRFGGPHYYFGEYFDKPFIGTNERQLNTRDMRQSIRVCLWTEVLMVSLITVSLIATSFLTSWTS